MGWGEPLGGAPLDPVRADQRIGRRDLARRLRRHAALHSDSKDIMLEAAAMLAPNEET